jgi:hypothetical protein
MSSSKISENEDSFIKGIITPKGNDTPKGNVTPKSHASRHFKRKEKRNISKTAEI